MFALRPALILALFILCLGRPLGAEPRFALVVGNSDYQHVTTLPNPSRDAETIAKTLEALGFEVIELIDVDRTGLTRGIVQFGRKLREAGSSATGLFYYAGHGVQSFGANYLLPVDVELIDAADLGLVALDVQTVLRQMYSAGNRTNIMILDACRNNPFSALPDFNEKGLAEMQAPTGTFLAYATAPGSVALDGAGSNSPFTSALARLMPTPGLPIEQMFKQVRIEVLKETGGMQTPWDSSSLTGDFSFVEGEKLTARDLEAQQFWESIKETRDPVQIMLFLRGYGDTAFAGEARGLLSNIMEQELAGVPKAPEPEAGPSDDEVRLFETAREENTIAAYEAYLARFPKGVFAEMVQQELVALREKSGHDPVGPGTATGPAPKPPAAPQPVATLENVTFTSPIPSDTPQVNGRSIAQLIDSEPLFPPIEGLPETYWKGQHCSNCHQWTEERICTQAQTYLSPELQHSLDKKHPLGGSFKRALKVWAEGGCP
ncbi:caspase family protein [Albibacillus kandeliae]|uniref:caspase family protein n=1 Tax=Albibacillus kandeliae TaxID=2174228 RepID=UPI000D69426C|nr:caspase family protein [Albibacillus kandeliae]